MIYAMWARGQHARNIVLHMMQISINALGYHYQPPTAPPPPASVMWAFLEYSRNVRLPSRESAVCCHHHTHSPPIFFIHMKAG
jgi:hypothetical protein